MAVPNTSASAGGSQARPVVAQLVAQHRQHVHDAHPRVGLGGANGDRAACEVHVTPAQGQRLADPQAGEGERGEQRAPLTAADRGALVELAGGVEQRCDVVGPVEPRASGRDRRQPSPSAVRGVAVDQLVLDGRLQDRGERRERLVDRRGAELALADLAQPVAVHVLDGDLIEPPRREHGQQVVR